MSEHWKTRWFFVVAFLVLAAGYGLRDPWPADEPRFVLVAKQMVEGGDWLFPHRGREFYPDKPPLYFWFLAAAYRAVGSWRWSFLLPSLLAGLGTLWLVQDLARRLWNPRAGLWAAIAVLSSLQFVYQFKRAQIDPSLVFFTTLAFYGLCRHLLLGPHWRWFWAACAAAGVGVALKGVGFLPLLMLLPFIGMRRAGWRGLAELGVGNGWRWGIGALMFTAAIALWIGPMLYVALTSGDPEHRAYLDNLLFKQTATRYVEAWHHRQPVWYFAEIVALFWWPFSLSFLWLWRDWFAAWRNRDARVWLPLFFGLIAIVFFSLSPGKRDMYVLPALPAIAVAAASYLPVLIEHRRFQRVLFVSMLMLAGLLFALGLWALLGSPKFAISFVAERGLDERARGLWWMLAAIGGIGIAAALALRAERAVPACGIFLLGLWCAYGWIAHPLLDPSSSSRALMQRARELAGSDVQIGLVGWKEQNLLQAVGPVEEFGFSVAAPEQLRRGMAWLQAEPDHRRLLVQQTPDLACLRGGPASEVAIANRRRWLLVSAKDVDACMRPTPSGYSLEP